jgi:hypothetical protein
MLLPVCNVSSLTSCCDIAIELYPVWSVFHIFIYGCDFQVLCGSVWSWRKQQNEEVQNL